MIKSQGWDWKTVEDDKIEDIWKKTSIESYYLVNRWNGQNKADYLDLGCGLGRHSLLFGKNGFKVHCLDISEYAITRTREWAESENSKETWKYRTAGWPHIDANTKLKMEAGPEYKVPHFYADYDLIRKLFNDFEIVFVNHVEEFYDKTIKLFRRFIIIF